MFNRETGFKIAVQVPPGGFPIVAVPPEQVDDVRRLLAQHGIGHTPESRLMRDDPSEEVVIHIGRLWDRQRIQDVLDSVQ
jgi:hypothetical protein